MNDFTIKKIALRVSLVTIAVNFLLTAFKIVAGILGRSDAMVSDGIHSASDVISTVIVIIGIAIAMKPTDNKHEYGHERLECIASIILSLILFGTGALIGYKGVYSLATGGYNDVPAPTTLALVAAIVSIVVKEGMYWYTIYYAKKTKSLSLKANAWHHRSDALSSVGALIGIGCTLLFNMPIFDDIASLVICLFILKVAVEIFLEAVDKLVDKSCPPEKEEELKNILCGIDGIITVDELKTRMFGSKIYVDIEIGADKTLTLEKAHEIAEKAHDLIEKSDENIKHCMVHVNPVDVSKKV